MHAALSPLHSAVSSWFAEVLGEPTAPQVGAWPEIRAGRDVLVAAPTGSGKTLAAFLAALDELAREAEAGTLPDEVRVVYVSPLKALSNDVHKNLMVPLEAIGVRLRPGAVELRAAVRTGDTPQKERAQVTRRPPHVLVTTPESLYVLLGSESGRRMLSTARSVIVDEIHAVAATRRGAHLCLSLERLEAVAGRKLQRVGLSATQRPVEEVARFLVGTRRVARDGGGAPSCAIVDCGHLRAVEVEIEVPRSPLEAVMSAEVWTEVVARMAELALSHRTTLVFVNTRRLAERVAAQLEARLAETIGPGLVCAHHGSMSRDKRLHAEQRLKAGDLRVLVATSSLELGIDVGAVELVCQVGVTKSIAALLQRVGRANHTTTGTPRGKLFPLSRDELMEAAALVDAIAHRDLDALAVPSGGLDILAQHIVAAVGDAEAPRDELYALARGAWPYRDLSREDFDDVIELLHEGVRTHRGRRGAHVFVDGTTGVVKGRRGARLAALTSGGAIPDQGDYTVVEEPQGLVVGTINEDFAIESMAGDIFQLGTTSWRILRVDRGTVRVEDAKGQPPSIPFWLGEAPARTRELSARIDGLRDAVSAQLEAGRDADWLERWLVEARGLPPAAARQLAAYLAATHAALGGLPTEKNIVFERFHDDLGGSQIVIHAPLGGRVTRAWGLALRKRFCRSFDFELQAAATEDAVLLSVGAVEGVDLTALPNFLSSKTVRAVLVQALLDAPMFGTRFRWNATRALTLLRMRGGKRVPPGLQRLEAEDLLVSLFPEQVACLENIVGDREIPDAVLVRQTVHDCLHEAMDIDGLEDVLRRVEAGEITIRCVETVMPSPLAHEILAAKPYAFLDDVPLEERRVQAVFVPRGLDGQGAPLDPAIVAEVLAELHTPLADRDEAHDLLLQTGFLFDDELVAVGGACMAALLGELALAGRVRRVPIGAGLRRGAHVAIERLARVATLGADHGSLAPVLLGRLEVRGPRPEADLLCELGVSSERLRETLGELERTGEVLRGRLDPRVSAEVVWSKRLVTRVRRRMLDRLRAQIEPVHAQDLMRFLLSWQRLTGLRAGGVDGLYGVITRLAGASAPAGAWEDELLARRVLGYDPRWLDQLCFAGRVAWLRLEGRVAGERASGPSRALRTSAIAVMPRELTDLFVPRPTERTGTPTAAEDVALSSTAQLALGVLRARGASFFQDVAREARLLPEPAEHALAELVAAGLASCDGFAGVRALLLSSKDRERARRHPRGRAGLAASLDLGGRWSASTQAATPLADEARAEGQARALLQRTGVVFRKLVERDAGLLPWRDLLFALRRLEARGDVRGGRFVAGFSGEQFALPEVGVALRAARSASRRPGAGEVAVVSAADPMNLTGIVLPGPRVPAVLGHRLLLEDGLVVAVFDAGGVRHTGETTLDASQVNALLRRGPRASARQADDEERAAAPSA
ncbi:MAG: DEAD/DEAH box helicase [Myxococcales bacterium]|nr:DEAD/DEAH box helicase [Myxococcales bacterium]